MPKGAEILTIQIQDGIPCLWALVDPDQKTESKTIIVLGTGDTISKLDRKEYIGTYQERQGMFVWHAFELIEG